MSVTKRTSTRTIALVRFAVASLALLAWLDAEPTIAQGAGYRVELESSVDCGTACYVASISGPWLDTNNGRFFATPAFNLAGGPGGTYLPSAVFDGNFTPRMVYASAPFPAGSVLDVFSYDAILEGETACIWTHDVRKENTSGNFTIIDRPALNGNAGRRLLVQGTFSSYKLMTENFGVWYDPLSHRWTIFLEDPTANFVLNDDIYFWGIDDSCASGITFHASHVASVANTAGNVTYLDEIPGIHRPATILLVTQLWSSAAPVYNDHPIGVWFDTYAGYWAIFNEDLAPMPLGARFMVATVGVVLESGFETGDFRGWSSHTQ